MFSLKSLGRRNWQDLVSAYVDGELHGRDLAWFEEKLAKLPAVAAAVAAEQTTREILVRSLPEVAAPRSFTIAAGMATEIRPAPPTLAAAQARRFGKLAAGVAVLAAAAFVSVTAADLAGDGGDDLAADDTLEFEALSATGAASPETADTQHVPDEGPSPTPGDSFYDRGAGSSGPPESDEQTRRASKDLVQELQPEDRGTGGVRAVQVILAIVTVAGSVAFVITRQAGRQE